MKTVFFSLLIACFGVACSDNAGLIPDVNEGEPVEANELIPVSFNVGFTKDVTPYRAGSDADFTLQNFSQKYLVHHIYRENTDMNGYFFYKKYTVTDSDGSISCELPEGNYISFFVAYNSGVLWICNAIIGLGNVNNFGFYVKTEGDRSVAAVEEDQFFNQTTYTVEKDTENSYPVILERIVGRVEIIFEDIIPQDVTKMVILNTLPVSFGNLGGSPVNYSRTYAISESDKISAGYTFSFPQYEGGGLIQLRTYGEEQENEDSGTGHYKAVWFKDINVQKGKILRYKGKFFEGQGTFSFVIKEWYETEEHTY
jgi:hypothetical protein